MSDKESPKVYELSEVRQHNDGKSCWMVIHDKVYDITKFLDEHPGGEEVLLELAGDDATEPFEDVGHSTDARDLLEDYYMGEVAPQDKRKVAPPAKQSNVDGTQEGGMRNMFLVLTILVTVGLAVGFHTFVMKKSL